MRVRVRPDPNPSPIPNPNQAKQICGKSIEIFWDGEDQWFEAEARRRPLAPSNPAPPRLQPPCRPGCSPCVYSRLQP